MKKYLVFLFISIFAISVLKAGDDPGNCLKRIKIKGIPFGEKEWIERTMQVYVHYNELTPLEKNKQRIDDSIRYQGWPFIKIGDPTNKMDCAGYTYHEQFTLAGEYWITAEQFYQNLVLPFAKQISDRFTWGDAQENDLVVFKKDGRPTHIAFIRKVEKTAGMVSAIYIVTKDAREGIYDHKLGFFLADAQGETNPLVAAMGYPYIYRVNYGNFDIDENYYKDCQEVPAEKKGIYSLKEVITDANVSYTEKDINANRYFFASTSYRDGSRFSFDMRLLSKMPAQVQPGTSFEIEVSIQSENAAALTDEGLHVNWYCGEQLLWRNSCDKEIRIGHDTKGIISEAREKLVVKVPECDGQKLICYFNRVRGYSLGEPTFMGWVKYIYEK